tara:strand:- start:1406 stop:1600 length:195 start_codon:yes stop_codon:yes gene_type:complete
MPEITFPFTDKDKTEINKQINKIKEAQAIIVKGKAAGLELDNLEEEAKTVLTKLQGIKSQFFTK